MVRRRPWVRVKALQIGEFLCLERRSWEPLSTTEGLASIAPRAKAAHVLADTELVAGELERATRLYRDALIEFERAGDERSVMLYAMAGLAAVAGTQREVERAGVLWGGAAAEEEPAGIPVPDYDRTYEKALTPVAGPGYAAAFERGRTMSYDEAVNYALGT